MKRFLLNNGTINIRGYKPATNAARIFTMTKTGAAVDHNDNVYENKNCEKYGNDNKSGGITLLPITCFAYLTDIPVFKISTLIFIP